jgi:hypothetical protein
MLRIGELEQDFDLPARDPVGGESRSYAVWM